MSENNISIVSVKDTASLHPSLSLSSLYNWSYRNPSK
jgi:hypothetical protein